MITAHSKQQLLWADHSYRNKYEGCSSMKRKLLWEQIQAWAALESVWGILVLKIRWHIVWFLIAGSLKMPVPSRLFMFLTVGAYKHVPGGASQVYYIATVCGEMGNKQKKNQNNPNKQTITRFACCQLSLMGNCVHGQREMLASVITASFFQGYNPWLAQPVCRYMQKALNKLSASAWHK